MRSLIPLLFVCRRNQLRSPTAEAVFAEYDGLALDSAGLDRSAAVPLGDEYDDMAADLVRLLTKKVLPLLGTF